MNCLRSIRVHTQSTSFDIEDICLVINNTGKDIKIDEFREVFGIEQPAEIHVGEGKPISKEGYIKIKPSEFRKASSDSSRIRPYKLVSLIDGIKNSRGLKLSMEEIQTNTAFVISMGENNQLVKENRGIDRKDIKSEEDVKEFVVSIVGKPRNDSPARLLPSKEMKNLGKGKNTSTEDICLVINNTGKDIKIDEFREVFGIEEPAERRVEEGKPIGKEGYIKIKPSEFRKGSSDSSRIRPYKLVSLIDGMENNGGLKLSMEEIQANTAVVISMGENNQLVKESRGIDRKDIKSEEDVKEFVISIVKGKTRNDSSGQDVQNSASAERSQKEKEKNLGRGKGKMKTPSKDAKVFQALSD